LKNKFFRRVSTIHTYPSSSSINQRQAIINEDDHQNEINQPTNIMLLQEKDQDQEQEEILNESNEVNNKI